MAQKRDVSPYCSFFRRPLKSFRMNSHVCARVDSWSEFTSVPSYETKELHKSITAMHQKDTPSYLLVRNRAGRRRLSLEKKKKSSCSCGSESQHQEELHSFGRDLSSSWELPGFPGRMAPLFKGSLLVLFAFLLTVSEARLDRAWRKGVY